METNSNDYRISFFKPTTPIALYNRNLVVWLASIWVIAIFGFQFTLRLIEKPTPEPPYISYEQVWTQIDNGQASTQELQTFAQSCLSVLGKNFIQPEEKAALDNGVNWALGKLIPYDQKEDLIRQIDDFVTITNSISNITDPAYVNAKNQLGALVSPFFGLNKLDARTRLVAAELNTSFFAAFSAENKALIPDTMSKYLIHNQSFLTDFKFLGFPFHYFYTAIFLLILFIGLCWLYCIRIDRRNIILGIEE